MTTTQDIVAKLWSLRDDGITYHEYVTELTFLLFLKMMKETEQESLLPKGYPCENGPPSKLLHWPASYEIYNKCSKAGHQ